MQQNTLPITIEDDDTDAKPDEAQPETIDDLNSSSLQGEDRSRKRHQLRSENADNQSIYYGH